MNINNTNFKIPFIITEGRDIFTSILIFAAYYTYVKNYIYKNQNLNFLSGLALIFIITSLIGILESSIGLKYAYSKIQDSERVLGFFGNPNETGLQACYTLILILTLYSIKKINLIITLLTIPVISYSIFLTFSKTSMITLLLIIICLFILSIISIFTRNTNSRLVSLSLFIAAFLFFVVLPISYNYYQKMETSQQKRITAIYKLIAKGEINNKTTSNRSGIFNDGFSLIKKKPFIGYGIRTFTEGGMFDSSPTHGVHNTYLKLIGESGIITITLFIVFLLYLFGSALFQENNYVSHLILLSLLAFSIYLFTSHDSVSQKFNIAYIAIVSAIGSNKISLSKI